MDQIDQTIHNEVPDTLTLNRNRYFEPNVALCQIEEGLFLGSLGDASNKYALKNSKVTHILTVANLSVPSFISFPNDFVYKTIRVMDREDTDLTKYFEECFNFIDEAKRVGGAVLVHCFMGISRSVTVVVAYMMKKHGMSFSQALEHVKSRRPQASPNSGFILQLQHFEKTLQGKEDGKTRFDLSASIWHSIFPFFKQKPVRIRQ